MQNIVQYYWVYFPVIFILFIYQYLFYRNSSKVSYSVYIIIIFLSCLIGSRGIEIGADTPMYTNFFNTSSERVKDILTEFPMSMLASPLYIICLDCIHKLTDESIVYFTINSFVLFFVVLKFCKKFCVREDIYAPTLLCCMICINFSFIGQQLNVIRIGAAFGFIYLYIYNFLKENYKAFAIYFTVAILIHITSLIPFACLFIAKKVNLKLWIYYCIYFISIVLSYLGFGVHSISNFLLQFEFNKFTTYLDNGTYGYNVGFRLDFIGYNTFYLLLFAFIQNKSVLTQLYVRYYILASSFFFLYLHIPYSDRVGAFSWCFIPIILFHGISKTYPRNRGYIFISFMILLITSAILVPKYN